MQKPVPPARLVNEGKPSNGSTLLSYQSPANSPKESLSPHTNELWLGIHFPQLALNLFRSPTQTRPIFIVDTIGQRQFIHDACDQANALGVVSGMPLGAAFTLCHQPLIIPRNEKKERRWLIKTAQRLSKYTPKISISGPHGLLLELSGSVKLFSGIKPLCQTIAHEFDHQTTLCLTRFPAAAALLARIGHHSIVINDDQLYRVLSAVDVQHLELGEKRRRQMQTCGIHNLGDLRRLPRQDLGRRFGQDVLTLMDQLTGAAPLAQSRLMSAVTFNKTITFPDEHNDRPTLELAAQSLLNEAQTFLRQHASMTQAIRFTLHHGAHYGEATPNPSVLIIRTQSPSHQSKHFLPQFITRLEQTELARQVIALQIEINHLIANTQAPRDLFDHKKDLHDWPHLLDTIRARLGESSVYGLAIYPDHRPERAWRKTSIGQKAHRFDKSKSSPALSRKNPQRPLWLVKRPEPLPLSNAIATTLTGQHTVERIEFGWWDGFDIRRDYQVLTLNSGIRVWIYQELTPRTQPARANNQWYLHGLFG